MCWSRLRVTVTAMTALSIVMVPGAGCGAEPDGENQATYTRLFGTVIEADGSPAANVPVSVWGYNDKTLGDTKTDDDGRFQLEIEQSARALANTAYFRAGNRRSHAITPVGVIKDRQYEVSEEPRQIVLSPTGEAVVSVLDSQGAPVGDGKVILQLQSFQLKLRRQTDREGNARFLIPESNSVMRVLAWKDGVGFAHRLFVPPRGDSSTKQADPPKFNDEGETLKLEPDAVDGLILLMVDSHGSLLERAGPRELMSKGKLSASAVVDFISRHPLTLPTGRERLDAALARAKREGKRVLVQETATWCGPCHKLRDLLLANPVWEKDFVYVMMDHRLDGALEIMKDLRDGDPGGIPWYAILDSDGKKLVTSNKLRDDQNIGFPSSPSGLEHFGRMFTETSERMTAADVDSLLAAIKQQAD